MSYWLQHTRNKLNSLWKNLLFNITISWRELILKKRIWVSKLTNILHGKNMSIKEPRKLIETLHFLGEFEHMWWMVFGNMFNPNIFHIFGLQCLLCGYINYDTSPSILIKWYFPIHSFMHISLIGSYRIVDLTSYCHKRYFIDIFMCVCVSYICVNTYNVFHWNGLFELFQADKQTNLIDKNI